MAIGEQLQQHNETQQNQDWSILSNLAKTPKQSYGWFTPDNTKNYIKDRLSDNLDVLEQDVGDSAFLELYEDIVDKYPILRTVILEDEDINDNAYFSLTSMQSDGTYAPLVACNMSHPETYAFDANENLETLSPMNDRLGTAYFIKRLAFAIGADWKNAPKM